MGKSAYTLLTYHNLWNIYESLEIGHILCYEIYIKIFKCNIQLTNKMSKSGAKSI